MLLATLSIWCNFHVNAIFDTGLSTNFSNKGFGQKARDQTKKPPSLREKCPYSYPLRIQSECGKIRTRITPNTVAF